jgi:hypothetical protein
VAVTGATVVRDAVSSGRTGGEEGDFGAGGSLWPGVAAGDIVVIDAGIIAASSRGTDAVIAAADTASGAGATMTVASIAISEMSWGSSSIETGSASLVNERRGGGISLLMEASEGRGGGISLLMEANDGRGGGTSLLSDAYEGRGAGVVRGRAGTDVSAGGMLPASLLRDGIDGRGGGRTSGSGPV